MSLKHLSSLPEVLDPFDLKDGCIVPPHVLTQVENKVKTIGRYSPAQLKEMGIECPYDVMVMSEPNRAYAIYATGDGGYLGKGSFGCVELVQDSKGQFSVAKSQDIHRKHHEEVFEAESQRLKSLQLNHGHAIYGQGKEKVGVCIMPLAQGVPLSQLISYPLKKENMLTIMLNTAKAVDALHQRGWLHLDIKPGNTMVNPVTFKVELVDFACALTHENGEARDEIRGSPRYAAEELQTIFQKIMQLQSEIKMNEEQGFHEAVREKREAIEELSSSIVFTTKSDIASLGKSFNEVFGFRNEVEASNDLSSLIASMYAKDPSSRPPLSEVIATLEQYRVNEKVVERVGLLDVGKYYHASADEKKHLIEKLGSYDRVQVVATETPVSESERNMVEQEIQQALRLSGKSIRVNTAELGETEQREGKWIEIERTKPSVKSEPTVGSVQRIPDKISMQDLSFATLLPASMMNNIKAKIRSGELPLKNPGGQTQENYTGTKISKRELRKAGIYSPYSVIVTRQGDGDMKIHAIYKGVKQGKELGRGQNESKVKLVVSEEGRFGALKIVQAEAERQGRYARKATNYVVPTELVHLSEVGKSSQHVFYQGKKQRGNTRVAVAIIMDLESGKPFDADKNKVPYAINVKLMREAAKGLKALHEKGILHTDLKPDNLFSDSRNGGSVSYIDFGTILHMNENGSAYGLAQGTAAFCAPEVLAAKESRRSLEYNEKIDVYGLGISLAIKLGLSKTITRDGQDRHVLMSPIDKAFMMLDSFPNENEKKEIWEFLHKMTAGDPNDRPSMSEVVKWTEEKFERLDDATKTMNVGVLNLDAFAKAYEKADRLGRARLAAELQQNDEIILLCPENELDRVNAQTWIKRIESLGVRVNNEVIVFGDQDPEKLWKFIQTKQPGYTEYHVNYQQVAIAKRQKEAIGLHKISTSGVMRELGRGGGYGKRATKRAKKVENREKGRSHSLSPKEAVRDDGDKENRYTPKNPSRSK